jgi:nucleotide-binding universal stress UspA family protein
VKKILVGLDGSPHERVVLDGARTIAEKLGARLTLFRAVSLPVELPASVLSVAPDDVADVLLRQARAALERVAAELPPSVRGGIRAELGGAWGAICDAARAEDVELIVIGSHGYGGLDRLLGTTAAKVVNHADRSVLVVRGPL